MTFKEAYTKANDSIHADRRLLEAIGQKKKKPVRINYLYASAAAFAALILLIGLRQGLSLRERQSAAEFTADAEGMFSLEEEKTWKTDDQSEDSEAIEEERFSDTGSEEEVAVNDAEESMEAANQQQNIKEHPSFREDKTAENTNETTEAAGAAASFDLRASGENEPAAEFSKAPETAGKENAPIDQAAVKAPTESRTEDRVVSAAESVPSLKSEVMYAADGGSMAVSSSKNMKTAEDKVPLDVFLAMGSLSKEKLTMNALTLSSPEVVAYHMEDGQRVYEDVAIYLGGDGQSITFFFTQRESLPYGPDGSPEDGIFAGFQCGGLFARLEAYGFTKAEIQTMIQTLSH